MGGIVFRKRSTYLRKQRPWIFRVFGKSGNKTGDYDSGVGEGLGGKKLKVRKGKGKS